MTLFILLCDSKVASIILIYMSGYNIYEKRMIVILTIKDCDMLRNLDLTALRSFMMVAETGGVTRAAEKLHLTQSAVSMQLKRLEESLGLALMDRAGRGIALTSQGELLLSYAKRILAINDEAWGRLTSVDFEGKIILGVPHDIVFPHIPTVLKRFVREFPRIKIHLYSSDTIKLQEMMNKGKVDLILGTEFTCPADAIILQHARLDWFGAENGRACMKRPLPLALGKFCTFRPYVIAALDQAEIAWEAAVYTTSNETVNASVSSDLAVHSCLVSCDRDIQSNQWEKIPERAGLPELPEFLITMEKSKNSSIKPVVDRLAELVQEAYRLEIRPEKKIKLCAI